MLVYQRVWIYFMIYRHDVSWYHICIYMHIVHLCLETKKCPGPICLLELKRDETNGIAKQVHSKARDLRVHASYRCPIFQHNFGARLKMEHTPMAGTFSREHGDKPSNSGVPMGYLWVPMGTLFSEKPILWPLQCQWICHSQLWGGNSPKSSAEEQREKKIPWCTWCRQSNSQTRGCRPTTNPSRRKWKNLR